MKLEYNIYLDYNATTPIGDEVAEAMRPYLKDYFGNPSSSHSFGAAARNAVENARRQLSELLNCHTDEIIFTSGGTEANNYAIKGVAFQYRNKGNHIITTTIEHPAVSEVCRFLEANGFKVSYIPVDDFGIVDPQNIEKAKNIKEFLDSSNSILDVDTSKESKFYVDELEISLAINASGGVELIGKLEAGAQAGIKIKLKRKEV